MRRTTGAAPRRAPSPCPQPAWTPVPRNAQEVDTTAARRARPHAWLPAVAWLIDAALHPRATATTLAVARDLAARMDYRLGFVLYDLEGTAARCGVSTATVKRHVRVLRELGALVWRRHGTKRNLRVAGRTYTATATIYAATVPAAYDDAMGHRLDGAGYRARVAGVTDEGRALAVKAAARPRPQPVDSGRRRTRGCGGPAPHSFGRHHDVPVLDPDGRFNYTSRVRAPHARAAVRRRPVSARGPSHRRPVQVARDIAVARQVRPLVGWVQPEGLRRLAFALRPLIDRGLEAHDIAAELLGMAVTWRPGRPAAYIAAALARDRAAPPEDEPRADPASHQEWQRWLNSRRTDTPARTDDDRRHARLYAWDRWYEVAAHYTDDPDDALDLYGARLCGYAVSRAARATGSSA
ncbi:cell wall protein [Streptomyces sp. NBC_01423]|uniref:cell wall protein n=1 Tax=Streptomyces sp. NBC_01423 TaxID=2903860 RepID=UPI002E28BC32|nr:cell wall protein [Streptomyces sp. NBC_01423]